MNKTEWLETIAHIIRKVAFEYGYKYPSAIIGQAILESGWGQSSLSSKYNNYFGLKCGSSWKGKSVNLSTKEEYTAGTLTNITANFRVYDNMEDGVRGYFEFIQYTRYQNLKSATSSLNYLELIKQDGYATSSNYVNNVYNVVLANNLLKYDDIEILEPNPLVNEQALETAIEILAEFVIAGKFGNGEERKNNLYKIVQDKVNEKLRG